MGIIDILVILTFIVSIGCAIYRGLVKELLGISSWIMAGLAALYGFTFIRPFFKLFIDSDLVVDLASAGTIALLVLILLTIINATVTGRLRKSSLSGLDRILGSLFGLLRAVLLVALAFLIAKIPFTPYQIEEAAERNFSLPYVESAAMILQKAIPEAWREDAQKTSGKMMDTAKKASEKKAEKAVKKTKEKAKEKVTEYTDKQRESLDDLIKNVEIGDLD